MRAGDQPVSSRSPLAASSTPAIGRRAALGLIAGSVAVGLTVALFLNLIFGGGNGVNLAEREPSFLNALSDDYPGAATEVLLSQGWINCAVQIDGRDNPYEARASECDGLFTTEDVLDLGADTRPIMDAAYTYLCPEVAP